MEKVRLKNIILPQLVKIFSSYFGNDSFIDTLKNLQLLAILSQINPIHALPLYLFTVIFNLILISTPRSPKNSIFLYNFPKIFLHVSLSPICTTFPVSLRILDSNTQIIFGWSVQIIWKWNCIQLHYRELASSWRGKSVISVFWILLEIKH